jgi:hypothetical protein
MNNQEWNFDKIPPEESEPQNGRKSEADTKTNLLDKAYELNFNAADIPPPEESCIYIGDDHPIAARGNLTGIL